MARKIEHLNVFANRCGYFYNAYLEKDVSINNGYNCNHPDQEEIETTEDGEKIGRCFCWSCPLGYEPDEEDFQNPEIDNQGYTYEKCEFIVIEA
jgi:uncharacterized protein YfaQ (DUF2300 family)